MKLIVESMFFINKYFKYIIPDLKMTVRQNITMIIFFYIFFLPGTSIGLYTGLHG